MKLKTKLTLGVGLLFAMIIAVSLIGAFKVNDLKSDTENILTANYHSLEYCRNMLSELNTLKPETFEINLKNQEKNVTEINEGVYTAALRGHYQRLVTNPNDSSALSNIQSTIFQIMDLNMQAIQRKSNTAQTTANNAMVWIAVSGILCFSIAFILLVNLPSSIARPIKELTESIKQIADKNYSERVDLESNNEFGELAASFNMMARNLKEYSDSNMAKLLMEKQRIDTLINNMHDPVIGLDEKMKVIFANEEAIKISGLRHHELIGQSASLLAIKNDLMRSLMQDLTEEKSTTSGAMKIYAEEKESYFEKDTLHINITPIGEQHPRLVGHVIMLRNVTQYKELEQAKTNFLATVSHEFKTPISSIKMSLQLLEDERVGELNTEQKELLSSITDDANRILKITGELLDITQVESGNMQLRIHPASPKKIVEYALNATKSQAAQKEVKITVISPDNLSMVHADQDKTSWILTNLVANAIQYSHEHATVKIVIKETSKTVQIIVEDTGQGIEEQYVNRIFERYFRAPGTKKEGTGLGLAISKDLVEAQGGSITVKSEYGAGSSFTLTLAKMG